MAAAATGVHVPSTLSAGYSFFFLEKKGSSFTDRWRPRLVLVRDASRSGRAADTCSVQYFAVGDIGAMVRGQAAEARRRGVSAMNGLSKTEWVHAEGRAHVALMLRMLREEEDAEMGRLLEETSLSEDPAEEAKRERPQQQKRGGERSGMGESKDESVMGAEETTDDVIVSSTTRDTLFVHREAVDRLLRKNHFEFKGDIAVCAIGAVSMHRPGNSVLRGGGDVKSVTGRLSASWVHIDVETDGRMYRFRTDDVHYAESFLEAVNRARQADAAADDASDDGREGAHGNQGLLEVHPGSDSGGMDTASNARTSLLDFGQNVRQSLLTSDPSASTQSVEQFQQFLGALGMDRYADGLIEAGITTLDDAAQCYAGGMALQRIGMPADVQARFAVSAVAAKLEYRQLSRKRKVLHTFAHRWNDSIYHRYDFAIRCLTGVEFRLTPLIRSKEKKTQHGHQQTPTEVTNLDTVPTALARVRWLSCAGLISLVQVPVLLALMFSGLLGVTAVALGAYSVAAALLWYLPLVVVHVVFALRIRRNQRREVMPSKRHVLVTDTLRQEPVEFTIVTGQSLAGVISTFTIDQTDVGVQGRIKLQLESSHLPAVLITSYSREWLQESYIGAGKHIVLRLAIFLVAGILLVAGAVAVFVIYAYVSTTAPG